MREVLGDIASCATLVVSGRVMAPSQFRDLLAGRSRSRRAEEDVSGTEVVVPDNLFARLVEVVRAEFREYIEPSTGRIGHAFPVGAGGTRGRESHTSATHQRDGVVSFEAVSHVETFAGAVARAAVVFGGEPIASLVTGWFGGEPARYQIRSIVNVDGILAEPLSPMEGVRLESLPLSTELFSGYLPVQGDRSPVQFLGRTVLTIDHSASPALFRPGEGPSVRAERATAASGARAEVVCQALALEADVFTEVALSWLDFGDRLGVFGLGGGGGVWSTPQANFRTASFQNYSLQTDYATGATTLAFEDVPEIVVDGERLGAALAALAQSPPDRLNVAASRWLRSKDPNPPLEDRFIDLRIALESLYLHDFRNEHSQEMGFRMALFGAWHLGADLEERRTIRKTLREAYNAASRAVHGGDIDSGRKNRRRKRKNPARQWSKNVRLLSEAQDILRMGLLTMIANGQPDDWGDLVLGGDETARA